CSSENGVWSDISSPVSAGAKAGFSRNRPARALADRSPSTWERSSALVPQASSRYAWTSCGERRSSACKKIALAFGFQTAMTHLRERSLCLLINARNGPELHAVPKRKYRRLWLTDLLVKPGSRQGP